MKKSLIISIISICLVVASVIICIYLSREKTTYYMDVNVNKIQNIIITDNQKSKVLSNRSDVKSIVDLIIGNKRNTTKKSSGKLPKNVNNCILITLQKEFDTNSNKIKDFDKNEILLYVYQKGNAYYIENFDDGVYQISADEYNSIYNYMKNDNIGLNNFYNFDITNSYKDIRELEKEYNIDDAIKDNCFVVNNAKVYNEDLYGSFMNKYESNTSAFIRLVKPTVEGDTMIYDIKYDQSIKRTIVVTDFTRDEFSSDNDRKITLREFENIGTYRYKGTLYWVAYNGVIDDSKFDSSDVLILATIN